MTAEQLEKLKALKKAQKEKGKSFTTMSRPEKDELLETIAKMLGLL